MIEELIKAAQTGNNQKISKLIILGVKINNKGVDGDTALIWAAYNGHNQTVQLLCDNNADTNIKGLHGNTALHWAAYQGHEDIIKILLRYNASPDIENDNHIKPAAFAYLNNKSFDNLLITSHSTNNHATPPPRLLA